VGAGSNWSQIACGYKSSFAIQSNGTLWAWGNNNSGALGVNTNTSSIFSPVQVGSLSVWTAVDGGRRYSLALQSNGTLWVSGGNDVGQ
jgi:alpha-tubulin suppressor-like RCC1 family protein